MKFKTSVKLFFIGLIVKTDIWAFRCNNGNEILDSLFCNSNDDCGDRSDEMFGCSTRRFCRKGKFTCEKSRTCMSVSVRCNGIIDCSDQSDEKNCVEQTRVEIQPQRCLLEEGKFLCKNKWACLDFSNACDGRCNCVDCSDENPENCGRLDSESCSSCTQSCLPTPDGPRCVCNATNYETNPICKEIQDCSQGSTCDQHCTRYKNFQRCLCYHGYREVSGTNGEKCETSTSTSSSPSSSVTTEPISSSSISSETSETHFTTEPTSSSSISSETSETHFTTEPTSSPSTSETYFTTESTTTMDSSKQSSSSTEQSDHTSASTYSSASTDSTSNSAQEELMDYVLIYSTATKIKAWHLSTNELEVIQDGVDITALTGIGNQIYYSTVDNDESGIFEISADSAQTHQLPLQIVCIDSRITSIGVDWITNNVYFTTNLSLSVCSSGGEICAKLKCCDTDAVALAPRFRWMFYTRKRASDGKSLIMKSDMDGSKENILLDESFNQLSSLTVDESIERLYWMVAKENVLHSVSFSGNGKKEEHGHFYKYFGAFEGNSFSTTEPNRLLWISHLGVFSIRDDTTNDVKFLHAYRSSLQNITKTENSENPCKSSSCTGLCLLHPGQPSISCICNNFIPTDDNHWCNKNIEFPAVLKSNDVSQHDNLSTEANENNSSKELPQLTNSISDVHSIIVSLQTEYLVASGVLGFILGLSSTSFIILVCTVFQKYSYKKSKRKVKINYERKIKIDDEIEL